MNHVILKPHGLQDGEWADVTTVPDVLFTNTQQSQVTFARIPKGTKSGRSTVLVRIDAPDGRVVILETTYACFEAAARGIIAGEEAFPDGLPQETH